MRACTSQYGGFDDSDEEDGGGKSESLRAEPLLRVATSCALSEVKAAKPWEDGVRAPDQRAPLTDCAQGGEVEEKTATR